MSVILNHELNISPAKKPNINYQSHNNVMHLMCFGKTETLSDKPAAPCTEGQMFALNTLGILFPGRNSAFGNMCLVSIVCVSVYGVQENSLFQFAGTFRFAWNESLAFRQDRYDKDK